MGVKRYDTLLSQLYNKHYVDLKFTVYNFIENDGYVNEISAVHNQKYDIDDFEFIVFDLPEDDSKAIKNSNAFVIQKYRTFKHYIEKECQTIPNCSIFILKDLGIVVAVKLKTFDIKQLEEK